MRLAKPSSTAIVLFVLATCCNAQDSSDGAQTLSIGDKLIRVEETLKGLQSQAEPKNINTLRKVEIELKSILQSDPRTVFRSQVEADLDVVNESLAYHDLLVARFYMSR